MEFDDFITLATPEGIELEMNLAGVGSRLIAGGIDMVLKLILIGASALALYAAGGFGTALFSVAVFVVLFGYDVLFEVLGRGRTPGKRLSSLRVVRADGSPVDLQSSAVRNIVRLVDGPTFMYIPTVVGILATTNNQRPGDLAADTVVIRTPKRRRRRRRQVAPSVPVVAGAVAAPWDVSAIGPEEMVVVRRFLERRDALQAGARGALAAQLADGLRPRVGGAPPGGAPEPFLETLVATKAARSGLLAPPSSSS
ncbi:MAG: RDD family protein [Solirubrobacteraceae bacterium]